MATELENSWCDSFLSGHLVSNLSTGRQRPPRDFHTESHPQGCADRAGAIGGLASALVDFPAGQAVTTSGRWLCCRQWAAATTPSRCSPTTGWSTSSSASSRRSSATSLRTSQTIDLTHNIAPFDVRAGSLALARCISYIPSGVIVAVVDPGVGGSRKSIAIEVADGEAVLVGPDNGLLAPAVAMAGGAGRAVVLTNEEYHLQSHGATFAGRDIFAPVAGHLCNGVDLAELGESIDADELLPGMVPLPREEPEGLVGEVLWVDHFGNCQLNIGPDEIAEWGPQRAGQFR